uniref:Multiple epidermal growth factor-like domains 10 n=1 Tax=Magallana gigas TaxID=29159 RepID=K1QCQ0_MAGGI
MKLSIKNTLYGRCAPYSVVDIEEINLYLNDTLHSNADVSENTPLSIACFVDGNPAPTIRLSRGQDCVPGFYGERCENNCGKCNNETTCNTASGVCPNDCQENWIPPFCADCKPNKYGLNCAFDCGHCKNDKPGSPASGTCIDGCDDGWTGIQCDTDLVNPPTKQ